MAGTNDATPARAQTSGAVDAFLKTAREVAPPREEDVSGRLVFALDATMSRQPTWDLAQSLQGKMFEAAGGFGGLAVQLVYFRGFGECRASNFVTGGRGLAALMSQITVRGGHTQIAKVLTHVREEARKKRIGALIFVGDAMEERSDDLAQIAGELSLLGVKAFMFQEGSDPIAQRTFREIARLTGGAWAAFDASAPAKLAELLAAAAAYAAGGRAALEDHARKSGSAQALLGQMR